MSWTDERIALLKRMWKEGKSAADIAKTLGKGATRNAVIGKAHRMGLSNRPSPIKKAGVTVAKSTVKKPPPKKKAPEKVVRPAAKKSPQAAPGIKTSPLGRPELAKPHKMEKEEIPSDGGVALIDLTERMCRWPIGDPREDDFTFCGHAIRPGTPYCADHAGMAYQSSSRTRAAAAAEEKEAKEEAAEDDVVEADDDDDDTEVVVN